MLYCYFCLSCIKSYVCIPPAGCDHYLPEFDSAQEQETMHKEQLMESS